ncbi:MAG: pantoate--beta-alanine ligase [Capnocytophaga sp.]|nr:pantoate--beta-alanine ligase [Capnocytophaga sp.]
MKIYHQKKELVNDLNDSLKKKQTIGFVPTMGALHEGHISLVKRALSENDVVVVSIFVNPTQFNNADDLAKYPRTLDADVGKIKEISTQVKIYSPNPDDVYDGIVISEEFDFQGLDKVMEGAFRPGHFDGVGTVVRRLFEIVRPTRAYFGEKDYQQLLIVKKMVVQTGLSVAIVPCPIVRAEDGLALSSRNARLSEEGLEQAAQISTILQQGRERFALQTATEVTQWAIAEFAKNKHFDLEYFIIADQNTLETITDTSGAHQSRAFVAVYIEGIRLIDNMAY